MVRANLLRDYLASSVLGLSVAALSATVHEAQNLLVPGELHGGGRIVQFDGSTAQGQVAPGDCITVAQRAYLRDLVQRYQRREDEFESFPPIESTSGFELLYTQYPLGGTLYDDVWTSNFVDLDTGPGILDWDCGGHTYDGHMGSDVLLRSFGEQAVGVPVFAALDGMVVATADGNPDMNTVLASVPANFVVIDHGSGRIAYYYHFKMGSVAVARGETVVAGEQIGEIGSSGFSNWPHLHFESEQLGSVIEPFTGTCNSGSSAWKLQTPIDYSFYLWDVGVTDVDLTPYAPPFEFPKGAAIDPANPDVFFWINLINLPAFADYDISIYYPDDTFFGSTGTSSFGNTVVYPYSWWWWGYTISEFALVPGEWLIKLEIDGELVMSAPFEVTDGISPPTDYAPEPISVSMDPLTPSPFDILMCRVNSVLGLDDRDYDIVRYHYVWKVNGLVVRDVTTAGRADALPRLTANLGDMVTCDVTPGDGINDGPTVQASTVYPSLVTDIKTLSLSAGGKQQLILNAGTAQATFFYWIFGSGTGTSPGIDFGGGHILPLNFDGYFNLTLNKPGLGAFGNFQGFLDTDGVASASFNLPAGVDPSLAGITLNHAYLTGNPIGAVQLASDAVPLTLLL